MFLRGVRLCNTGVSSRAPGGPPQKPANQSLQDGLMLQVCSIKVGLKRRGPPGAGLNILVEHFRNAPVTHNMTQQQTVT